MKKFKYYGREVEVPDYATHIAVDADGEGWWFNSKPYSIQHDKEIWICNYYNGSCGRVGHFDNVDNWKGSLRSC